MEAVVNNLIKAIGWGIFHSLWQAAIIYGLLLLLVAIFPKMTARLKHNLAYGAICLMFTGFSITFFSIFKLPVDGLPLTSTSKEIALLQYASGLPDSLQKKMEQLFPYLVNVYAVGLLCQFLILIVGYKRLQLLKRSDKIQLPPDWKKIFTTLLAKLELKQPIHFFLSDQVNIPLVIGYFKPVVLFPLALVTQLDMKQLEAILIHELSHIRRNDYLLNLIKTAIETLMFFNPFIWLSSRFINIEREHACDDLVLKLTGTPLTYAHALLKLEILKDKTTPALSMAANGNSQHLYQRIKRITDMKTNYRNAKQQFFAITLTIATVVSLAWINPQQGPEATKQIIMQPEVPPVPPTPKSPQLIRLPSPPAVPLPALRQDTTRKKHKFKIVTIDAKGHKQEYNSIKEMPDSLRREVIKETFVDRNNFDFHMHFNMDSTINKALAFKASPDWRTDMKKMSENLHRQFNAIEWKKNEAALRKNAEKVRTLFNSNDWKKQEADIKKSVEKTISYFKSDEWKEERKQMADHIKEIELTFNSPEFKAAPAKVKLLEQKIRLQYGPDIQKKIEAAKTLERSREYQELKKKFDEEVEMLKKKSIKTDSTSL